MYIATVSVLFSAATQAVASDSRQAFVKGARLPPPDLNKPRASQNRTIVSALTFDLGQVGSTPISVTSVLYYDEVYPIYYFRQFSPLTPLASTATGRRRLLPPCRTTRVYWSRLPCMMRRY